MGSTPYDACYLALLALAEEFRTMNPPNIRNCIQCLCAIFNLKQQPPKIEARTHLQLGNILLQHTKNTDLAQSHLEKAISGFDDVKFEAASVLADLYEKKNQMHMAKSMVGKAVEISQQSPFWHCRLLFQLAHFHASEKEYAAACGVLGVGAEFAHISGAQYTRILFLLSKGMLLMIDRKLQEVHQVLTLAGQLVEAWQGSTAQKEALKGRVCATADEGAAKIFPEELAKIIEDGDYSADQVFNADETGLLEKMPNRTSQRMKKLQVDIKQVKIESPTLLLCSNASGDRMLKPLLINKSLRPRALKDKDLKQLPVHWMANPKSWMTTAIFLDWFNNCFVSEVEAYMKEKSLDFKVLLIVDSAASHPQLEHPNVQLVFLPPNTTSLIQPLDQGIIATFKKYYIKTTSITVDGVVGLEGDNDEEEKSTPLTGKLIQEGLQLCSKLENHFLINDPNSERASKLQHELQNCMSGYRELYQKNKRILVKSVKPCLKQLQQGIQTITSLHADEEVIPTNPGDMFQWMPKEHMCVLVYLVTVLHSMQAGYMDKAQKYTDKALMQIEKLKMIDSHPILHSFQLLLLEHIAMCRLVMGNKTLAIQEASHALQICKQEPRLFVRHRPQINALLGLYAMSMNCMEAAEAQFGIVVRSNATSELRILASLNLAIVYLRSKRDHELVELLSRLNPETLPLVSHSLRAAAYYVHGLNAFFQARYNDAKRYLRETLKMANAEDLNRLTSCSLVLLGHIFFSLGNSRVSSK
ncbi:MAU2 chromatid cohesion factor homolog [Trichonephila clavipes]|nr:MAU2 chromatid cohesion factor homolog [Trichonephila clavipes]